MYIHALITRQIELIESETKQKHSFFEFGIYGLLGEGDDENKDVDTDEEEEEEDEDDQYYFLIAPLHQTSKNHRLEVFKIG